MLKGSKNYPPYIISILFLAALFIATSENRTSASTLLHNSDLFSCNLSITRYGDVRPLLSEVDDKYVIYGGGDEIALTFRSLEPPNIGLARSFLLYTNGNYKDLKVDVPHTVEPLPFAGMSNFSYDPSLENYPADLEHEQYRQEYNSRVFEE